MRIPLCALSVVLAAGSVCAESIELKPFPEFSAPRAVTAGPHDHFFANYFAINAWSLDNRYLLVLETYLEGTNPAKRHAVRTFEGCVPSWRRLG